MERTSTSTSTASLRMTGITLLELLAVVMIIGVLVTIAVPGYRQYTLRAHRTEAKSALLKLAANQERYYLANRTYGTIVELQQAGLLGGSNGNAFSERGTYRMAVTNADTDGFTATASPAAGAEIDMTADAACTSFSITAQGARTATGTAAASCW